MRKFLCVTVIALLLIGLTGLRFILRDHVRVCWKAAPVCHIDKSSHFFLTFLIFILELRISKHHVSSGLSVQFTKK